MAQTQVVFNDIREKSVALRQAVANAVEAIRPYTAEGGAGWTELDDFFTAGNGGDLSQAEWVALITSIQAIDSFITTNFHDTNLYKA